MANFENSSECKFGKMLNKVQTALPAFREILISTARVTAGGNGKRRIQKNCLKCDADNY